MKNEEFMEIIRESWDKLIVKTKEYGNSWRICSIEYLEKRLLEEMVEIFQADGSYLKSKECQDVINIAVMLAIRYREKCSKSLTNEVDTAVLENTRLTR